MKFRIKNHPYIPIYLSDIESKSIISEVYPRIVCFCTR